MNYLFQDPLCEFWASQKALSRRPSGYIFLPNLFALYPYFRSDPANGGGFLGAELHSLSCFEDSLLLRTVFAWYYEPWRYLFVLRWCTVLTLHLGLFPLPLVLHYTVVIPFPHRKFDTKFCFDELNLRQICIRVKEGLFSRGTHGKKICTLSRKKKARASWRLTDPNKVII